MYVNKLKWFGEEVRLIKQLLKNCLVSVYHSVTGELDEDIKDELIISED